MSLTKDGCHMSFYAGGVEKTGWTGYIEFGGKQDPIAFFRPDKIMVWTEREKSGAVIGDGTAIDL